MQRFITLLICVAAVATVAHAYKFQPQKPLGQLVSAADASTDCDAASSITHGTAATASLTCANTGAISTAGFDQVTIQIVWARNSGTAINMQCDTSITAIGATKVWSPIYSEDSDGEKTVRTWTETISGNTTVLHNFDINAEYIRCRFWATSGAASDTVTVYGRLASATRE